MDIFIRLFIAVLGAWIKVFQGRVPLQDSPCQAAGTPEDDTVPPVI